MSGEKEETPFYIYSTVTGHYLRSGKAPAQDMGDQWVQDDEQLTLEAPANMKTQKVDLATGAIVPRVVVEIPPPSVSDADRVKLRIELGKSFVSSVTGVPRKYSPDLDSRISILEAAALGGPILCDAGNNDWIFVVHTPEQAQGLLSEYVVQKTGKIK